MKLPGSRRRPQTLTIAAIVKEEIEAILGSEAVAHEQSDINEKVSTYEPKSVLPPSEETPSVASSLAEELKRWFEQSDLDPRDVAERKNV